jgi:hypothetical protein
MALIVRTGCLLNRSFASCVIKNGIFIFFVIQQFAFSVLLYIFQIVCLPMLLLKHIDRFKSILIVGAYYNIVNFEPT